MAVQIAAPLIAAASLLGKSIINKLKNNKKKENILFKWSKNLKLISLNINF